MPANVYQISTTSAFKCVKLGQNVEKISANLSNMNFGPIFVEKSVFFSVVANFLVWSGAEVRYPEDACQKCLSWFSDVFRLEFQGADVRKFCRFRRCLQNKGSFAKIGFDTAKNKPSKICYKGLTHGKCIVPSLRRPRPRRPRTLPAKDSNRTPPKKSKTWPCSPHRPIRLPPFPRTRPAGRRPPRGGPRSPRSTVASPRPTPRSRQTAEFLRFLHADFRRTPGVPWRMVGRMRCLRKINCC